MSIRNSVCRLLDFCQICKMNWVGGARSRMKMRNEKKLQKEFFEKKRFAAKHKRTKQTQSAHSKRHMSQDLLALMTVDKAHSGQINVAELNQRHMSKLDLDKFHSSGRRVEEVEMPWSPVATPSSLPISDVCYETEQRKSSNSEIARNRLLPKERQTLGDEGLPNINTRCAQIAKTTCASVVGGQDTFALEDPETPFISIRNNTSFKIPNNYGVQHWDQRQAISQKQHQLVTKMKSEISKGHCAAGSSLTYNKSDKFASPVEDFFATPLKPYMCPSKRIHALTESLTSIWEDDNQIVPVNTQNVDIFQSALIDTSIHLHACPEHEICQPPPLFPAKSAELVASRHMASPFTPLSLTSSKSLQPEQLDSIFFQLTNTTEPLTEILSPFKFKNPESPSKSINSPRVAGAMHGKSLNQSHPIDPEGITNSKTSKMIGQREAVHSQPSEMIGQREAVHSHPTVICYKEDVCSQPANVIGHREAVHSHPTVICYKEDVCSQPANVIGHSEVINSQPANVIGHSEVINSQPANVIGHSEVINSQPANVIGHSEVINSQPANVIGYREDYHSPPAKVIGLGKVADSQPAKVIGYRKDVQSQPANVIGYRGAASEAINSQSQNSNMIGHFVSQPNSVIGRCRTVNSQPNNTIGYRRPVVSQSSNGFSCGEVVDSQSQLTNMIGHRETVQSQTSNMIGLGGADYSQSNNMIRDRVGSSHPSIIIDHRAELTNMIGHRETVVPQPSSLTGHGGSIDSQTNKLIGHSGALHSASNSNTSNRSQNDSKIIHNKHQEQPFQLISSSSLGNHKPVQEKEHHSSNEITHTMNNQHGQMTHQPASLVRLVQNAEGNKCIKSSPTKAPQQKVRPPNSTLENFNRTPSCGNNLGAGSSSSHTSSFGNIGPSINKSSSFQRHFYTTDYTPSPRVVDHSKYSDNNSCVYNAQSQLTATDESQLPDNRTPLQSRNQSTTNASTPESISLYKSVSQVHTAGDFNTSLVKLLRDEKHFSYENTNAKQHHKSSATVILQHGNPSSIPIKTVPEMKKPSPLQNYSRSFHPYSQNTSDNWTTSTVQQDSQTLMKMTNKESGIAKTHDGTPRQQNEITCPQIQMPRPISLNPMDCTPKTFKSGMSFLQTWNTVRRDDHESSRPTHKQDIQEVLQELSQLEHQHQQFWQNAEESVEEDCLTAVPAQADSPPSQVDKSADSKATDEDFDSTLDEIEELLEIPSPWSQETFEPASSGSFANSDTEVHSSRVNVENNCEQNNRGKNCENSQGLTPNQISMSNRCSVSTQTTEWQGKFSDTSTPPCWKFNSRVSDKSTQWDPNDFPIISSAKFFPPFDSYERSHLNSCVVKLQIVDELNYSQVKCDSNGPISDTCKTDEMTEINDELAQQNYDLRSRKKKEESQTD